LLSGTQERGRHGVFRLGSPYCCLSRGHLVRLAGRRRELRSLSARSRSQSAC